MMLLALQYYKGDMDQAMKLARLIADNEPKRCKLAEFAFCARYDTEFDDDTIEYVAKKFRVHQYKSTRKAVGWPNGCNALWHATTQWAFEKKIKDRELWDSILTFEADCLPLHRDWIFILNEKFKLYGRKVLGCHIPNPEGCRNPLHVNGNAVFPIEMVQTLRIHSTPTGASWDVYHSKAIMKISVDDGCIKSEHGTRHEVTAETLLKPSKNHASPIFHHGCKHESGLKIAREMLIPKGEF